MQGLHKPGVEGLQDFLKNCVAEARGRAGLVRRAIARSIMTTQVSLGLVANSRMYAILAKAIRAHGGLFQVVEFQDVRNIGKGNSGAAAAD